MAWPITENDGRSDVGVAGALLEVKNVELALLEAW
jgi:hypothetical protein